MPQFLFNKNTTVGHSELLMCECIDGPRGIPPKREVESWYSGYAIGPGRNYREPRPPPFAKPTSLEANRDLPSPLRREHICVEAITSNARPSGGSLPSPLKRA